MKLIFLLSFFIANTISNSFADTLEINPDNLTLLALKYSSKEVVNEYASYLARSKHSKTFFKYIKNKPKRLELISQVENDLKSEIAKMPKSPEFIYTKEVRLAPAGGELLFNINKFSTGTVFSVFREYSKNEGLPDYFYLLFANLEILQKVKFNKTNLVKIQELRETKNIKHAYVEARLVLTNYQNQQDFQVVIKEISVYADKSKKLLLATKHEKRTATKISNEWLLAGGFTNRLVGIHAFSVFGYRLQDMMNHVVSLQKFCKKTTRIGTHQIIICELPYGDNAKLVTKYIGGKFAQLDILTTNKLTPLEQKDILRNLSTSLKKPHAFFKDKIRKWSQHLSDFEFYPDVFFDRPSKEISTLFKFDKNPALVFTMTSQATKKLIEKSK